MPAADAPEVLWSPAADAGSATNLGRFMSWLRQARGLAFDRYADLWSWSVEDLDGFWSAVWEFSGVRSHGGAGPALAEDRMPGARWFPGARLNYAEHAVGRRGPGAAVVSLSQTRPRLELSWDELAEQVARARAGLERAGVGPGDRVAAYLPNIAEAVVAFLAAASLGAVWSSCAPEFGVTAVLDRFGQIEPAVLLVVDGYRYGERSVDRAGDVAAIRAGLPSVTTTVVVPYLRHTADALAAVEGALAWEDFAGDAGGAGEAGGAGGAGEAGEAPTPAFEPVPFDHPLYVLYSSGTTGLPKAIVHGHGGILIEHLKTLGLHGDLGEGDRFCWFSTTGWMMWNYLVSGLLVGASIVLFDGDPAFPDLGALWRMAAGEGVTWFGTSAPFLLACRKAGLRPGEEHDLRGLRAVGSTGAPLPAEGFRWVYDAVSPTVLLSSISGGTDLCTAVVGGCPLVHVWAGEISCRYLGAAVAAFDADGRPVVGREGELVITRPMPSMPVRLWGDGDGTRMRAAYFDTWPGVWRHGDWVTFTDRGSCVISGRSDATLNRGGVRLGTSEFYAVVESFDEVADSLVVHLEDAAAGPGRLLLFVVPAPGADLDDALSDRLRDALRRRLSPRHVPDRIVAVAAVPRTLSGKKLEVPVKRILTGRPVDQVASRDALADPSALDPYEAYARGAGGLSGP